MLLLLTIPLTYAKAQTPIDNSYFASNMILYIWDIAGSPYEIMSDIEIPHGSDLMIEPGVEVFFHGDYKMDVKGSINAIGIATERISITSDPGNPWNGIRFDFSDNPHPASSKLHYCDISNAGKNGIICASPDPGSSGGAIYVESFSDLEIINCEIFNNSVQGQGGAIGLYVNSSPKIEKCNIHDNSALKRGGGICMMNGCSPQIIGNTIQNNESIDKGGGAIAMGDLGSNNPCTPTINNNYIYNNYALKKGGGVFICNSNPSQFRNNVFEGNTSQGNGGGIHIRLNSTVYLENNNFIENLSISNGGAISIGPFVPNVTIHTCQFSGNASVNGGALYVDDAVTDIWYSQFNNNSASTHGGGIYVNQSTSQITSCNFNNNTATGNGGGMYLKDPKQQNSSDISSTNLNSFKSNTAYLGSALYLDRTYNYTNSTKVINNLFAENHATEKGVVYLQGDNTNTIFNHNTVTNNTTDYFVSGVCVEYDYYFPDVINSKNFHNNIIHEAIVDVYITSTYQHPSNYQVLTSFNYLNYYFVINPPNPPTMYLNPNPGFVSATDYHLISSSACIDVGINTAPRTASDLDGNQRIVNNITDYGCYEYGSTPPARKSKPTSNNTNNDFNIYPNPASDFLYIATSNEQNLDISIYNISGQRVYFSENKSIKGREIIHLSDFKAGVYIIKLQTDMTTINKRIIIQ